MRKMPLCLSISIFLNEKLLSSIYKVPNCMYGEKGHKQGCH